MRYLIRTVKMALKALRRNIMRSALTTLGIIIGVAAVIITVEVGQGASKAVKQNFLSMGADNLLIQPGTAASGGVSFGSGTVVTLTPDDAIALTDPDRCSAIMAVAPIVRVRTQIVYNNKNWVPIYLYGTTPTFLEIRSWENLADGNAFAEQDVNSMREVCLLGKTVVRELFGDESPLGQKVRINNRPFTVLGVLAPKGANMMGVDQDDIVLAPWKTIKFKVAGQSAATANQSAAAKQDTTQQVNTLSNVFPGQPFSFYPTPSPTQMADNPQSVRFTNVDQILAQARSSEQIPDAIRQINEVVRERHHIRPGQADDFNIRDMTEMSKSLASTTTLMAGLLLCVALISLVVGGVGIMNIMLVSVTERTREIGLRMAVGARARDILRQFLVEAILLCLMGGFIGIVVGRLGSIVVEKFKRWPTEPSMLAIVGSVAVSALVGVAFGYYPAWKASRLDPIEALRYE
jgi:ABC-type antimicrobial peptide transport system permease subunit